MIEDTFIHGNPKEEEEVDDQEVNSLSKMVEEAKEGEIIISTKATTNIIIIITAIMAI